jgi:uncharacterized protein (DUF1697 family)
LPMRGDTLILPSMQFVAFLRNVNLGQPRSPTRAQLEAAFLQAGAGQAASFMTNGTLVFSVARRRQAPSTARRAGEILSQVCGLKEPVFVCPLEVLVHLAAEEPFTPWAGPAVAECCISFFEPKVAARLKPPLESERKDCLVFRVLAAEGAALSVVTEVGGKIGYPTPVLEKALGLPVTTRAWRTILRLVARHG